MKYVFAAILFWHTDLYSQVHHDKGDTIVLESFSRLAIVRILNQGIVGIDSRGNMLFQVYVFDNGPDYPSDGLFRIVKTGKIGYADTLGNIVITPVYDCAFPFENGIAKVGTGCTIQSDGVHSYWTGGNWFNVDKKGAVVK
jgi:hypothetical protein